MNGDIPEDASRRHQEAMLDAISIRDLPKNEVYGIENGTSVVKHDLRYANFFKQVCLEQQDLLEELAHSEENFFIVRKEVKRSKKKYLAKVDQLCTQRCEKYLRFIIFIECIILIRYENFLTLVCLVQQDLLEELAHSEENFFIVRKEVKRSKKKYLAKVDQLCSILRKRLDRPDSDTDSDIYPSEGSFQIRRT